MSDHSALAVALGVVLGVALNVLLVSGCVYAALTVTEPLPEHTCECCR